jgi:dephospho-CoA kinase
MYAGKPIIGLVGGIGSGKSFVARLFAEMGCLVIDSDAQVRDTYRDPHVLQTIRGWWGDEVFHPDGTINRSAIAARVFVDPAEKRRLEELIHPLVHAARERQMRAAASDAQVIAYVWDTPLLLEAGLASQCDAVVFVEASAEQRLARVKSRSAWDRAELLRRENSQLPLDSKRELSDYAITNTADAAGPDDSAYKALREQVQRVLSQILNGSATKTRTPRPG